MHTLNVSRHVLSAPGKHTMGHQHNRRRLRTNLAILIALWLILLIASLTVLSSVITPFLRSLRSTSISSLDWAGYVVSSDLLFQQPVVNSVSASWTVPYVSASSADAFSAAWVGIGGQSETTLIQGGTEHDSLGGQTYYSAWYEMLPDNSITIPNLQISPGDTITASVTKADAGQNWRIQLTDSTTGQSFSQVFAYNSSQLSAEWVMERPTVNNRISALANFGSVTFTNAQAEVSGTSGTISASANYAVAMQNNQGTLLAGVSNLNSDGSSFSVFFERSS
jgi:hypothetical protein